MGMLENFRAYRSKKLDPFAKAVVKTGLTANHITILSLLSGIIAVYFLFQEYYLFALFILLHLCLDGFDGVIARASKPTAYGKYFDLISDSSITFLILLKVAWHLQELYAYLAAGLFLLALLLHLKSKLQAPMLFMRTITVIFMLIVTHALFPFTEMLLTIGYLGAGGVSLYSLARQLQWYVSKNRRG